MGSIDYKGGWQRRLWQFMDAVSVNLTSDDLSLSVVNDLTRKARQGEVYHFSHLFSSVADSANADILISTGAERVSLTFSVSVAADTEVRIYETTVVSNSGSAVTSFNRNRTQDTTFTSTVTHTPTVSELGTLVTTDYLPGGEKNKEVGSSSSNFIVWVLKPDTNYLFRSTNTSGGTEKVLISGDIFEDAVV